MVTTSKEGALTGGKVGSSSGHLGGWERVQGGMLGSGGRG